MTDTVLVVFTIEIYKNVEKDKNACTKCLSVVKSCNPRITVEILKLIPLRITKQ